MMVYNIIMTTRKGSFQAEEPAQAPAMKPKYEKHKGEYWHRWIERRPMQMLVGSLVLILIGGMVEMVPTFMVSSNVPTIESVKPYTALELEGRDLYIREGCYTCHSQMIRPFRSETERYGEYSKAGEFVYDHPFQWGSKRTGPDLHRIGKKYNDSWHFNHMLDPRSTSPRSIMPRYPWLYKDDLDISNTAGKIRAMQTLGVPYPEGFDQEAVADLKAQAQLIVANLKAEGTLDDASAQQMADKEIIALIAYLQRMGTDIQVTK